MSDPKTYPTNEDAAHALRHDHPKSSPPRLMSFPGRGGDAPGANGPATVGENDEGGAAGMGAPDNGGPAGQV